MIVPVQVRNILITNEVVGHTKGLILKVFSCNASYEAHLGQLSPNVHPMYPRYTRLWVLKVSIRAKDRHLLISVYFQFLDRYKYRNVLNPSWTATRRCMGKDTQTARGISLLSVFWGACAALYTIQYGQPSASQRACTPGRHQVQYAFSGWGSGRLLQQLGAGSRPFRPVRAWDVAHGGLDQIGFCQLLISYACT